MNFSIVVVFLSMAAFAVAAPVANEDIAARQNHGMCVSSTDGTPVQIEGC
ncbi:uncharacterized protein SETTUDRAFT_26074 [Exserohilum turcica Et28A]|uniref:Uncharacterized protein n=1 Tax=Exserohilum turcicum (strain 28A) TaxID=671987 RepID=R0KPH1_EXST2|nr:uncharacterized protein SETTUDRAFT_26074 [Exserohilum turcica Et28A]EOA89747.1 hypothetical protein SETTUDRAFT_26074 [Exserohilum turcica Et28A]